MSEAVPTALFLKSLLVGTPLERSAKQLKWWLGAAQRRRCPELWETYLEDRRTPAILQRLLKPDSCGVDVGAHIGSFLSLLCRYAPHGKHVAFEPSQTKSAWLKRKFGNADVIASAVGEAAGSSLFEENRLRPGFSRLVSAPSQHPTYKVAVCRLDDALRHREHVDLLKLDIEGGELAALRGAEETIAKHRPAILFECGTEEDLDRIGITRQEIYDHLSGTGYGIFTYADFLYGRVHLQFDEFRRCGIYPFRAFNFIALHAAAV